jgi:hypothetical protein
MKMLVFKFSKNDKVDKKKGDDGQMTLGEYNFENKEEMVSYRDLKQINDESKFIIKFIQKL